MPAPVPAPWSAGRKHRPHRSWWAHRWPAESQPTRRRGAGVGPGRRRSRHRRLRLLGQRPLLGFELPGRLSVDLLQGRDLRQRGVEAGVDLGVQRLLTGQQLVEAPQLHLVGLLGGTVLRRPLLRIPRAAQLGAVRLEEVPHDLALLVGHDREQVVGPRRRHGVTDGQHRQRLGRGRAHERLCRVLRQLLLGAQRVAAGLLGQHHGTERLVASALESQLGERPAVELVVALAAATPPPRPGWPGDPDAAMPRLPRRSPWPRCARWRPPPRVWLRARWWWTLPLARRGGTAVGSRCSPHGGSQHRRRSRQQRRRHRTTRARVGGRPSQDLSCAVWTCWHGQFPSAIPSRM